MSPFSELGKLYIYSTLFAVVTFFCTKSELCNYAWDFIKKPYYENRVQTNISKSTIPVKIKTNALEKTLLPNSTISSK